MFRPTPYPTDVRRVPLSAQIEHVLRITPEVTQPLLYDLCGLNLGLIFELAVPSTSVVIQPLIDVNAIGETNRQMSLDVLARDGGSGASHGCSYHYVYGITVAPFRYGVQLPVTAASAKALFPRACDR